jgi:hypothetical protein
VAEEQKVTEDVDSDNRSFRVSRTAKDRDKTFSIRKGIPSAFKAMRRRIRRRKSKQALIEGKEIPRFRTSDHWEYW